MPDPIIVTAADRAAAGARLTAAGTSFSFHEWRGSGPSRMHVHYDDDEAWHVLEGTLRFRFAAREVDAAAGTSIFVPAGVAHTYTADAARYLIVLTPRLRDLIAELQSTKDQTQHAAVYRKYRSELLD